MLIRDAAYEAIPKVRRAEQHERVAILFQSRSSPGEVVGYHFEQAYRCLVEVGKLGEVTREIGRRGAAGLVTAGHRASGRGDKGAAVKLFGRAVQLVDDDDPGGPTLYWLSELPCSTLTSFHRRMRCYRRQSSQRVLSASGQWNGARSWSGAKFGYSPILKVRLKRLGKLQSRRLRHSNVWVTILGFRARGDCSRLCSTIGGRFQTWRRRPSRRCGMLDEQETFGRNQRAWAGLPWRLPTARPRYPRLLVDSRRSSGGCRPMVIAVSSEFSSPGSGSSLRRSGRFCSGTETARATAPHRRRHRLGANAPLR